MGHPGEDVGKAAIQVWTSGKGAVPNALEIQFFTAIKDQNCEKANAIENERPYNSLRLL